MHSTLLNSWLVLQILKEIYKELHQRHQDIIKKVSCQTLIKLSKCSKISKCRLLRIYLHLLQSYQCRNSWIRKLKGDKTFCLNFLIFLSRRNWWPLSNNSSHMMWIVYSLTIWLYYRQTVHKTCSYSKCWSRPNSNNKQN